MEACWDGGSGGVFSAFPSPPNPAPPKRDELRFCMRVGIKAGEKKIFLKEREGGKGGGKAVAGLSWAELDVCIVGEIGEGGGGNGERELNNPVMQ